jgi:DNA adenine methylase
MWGISIFGTTLVDPSIKIYIVSVQSNGILMETVKPFLKWVGGKTQILDHVLPLFPKEMVNYHEPFLGGGSVLLALLTQVRNGAVKVSGRMYASDLNSNLISLYKNVQERPEDLIAEVKKLAAEFAKAVGTTIERKPTTPEEALTSPESYYYWIRSAFNALPQEARASPAASAMVIFMNKTCFRGVYREGPNGFNVPYGNYKNPAIVDEDHIRLVSQLIKDVVFTVQPFTESMAACVAGDFVYLDPPYAGDSFVSYTKDGFGPDNHKRLFQLCAGLREKNVGMLMSNAEVKLVKDAFPSPTYMTKIVSCKRSINSRKPDAKANEVLITN